MSAKSSGVETKNVLLAPIDEQEQQRLQLGMVNFHELYNEFYKKAKTFHSVLEQTLNTQRQEMIDKKIQLDEIAYEKIMKIWQGPCYLQIIRDPVLSYVIKKRTFLTEKPRQACSECTHADISHKPECKTFTPSSMYEIENCICTEFIPGGEPIEFYQIPSFSELDPVTNTHNNTPIIELEIGVPIQFALDGLSQSTIDKYFPSLQSTDIQNTSLHAKTRYVSKTTFYRLIRIVRTKWEYYYHILFAQLRNIMKNTGIGIVNSYGQAKVFG